MAKYKNRYRSFDSIGRKYDIPTLPYGATALEQRLFEVSKLEQQKRLDFIKNALESYISEIEQATKENKLEPEPTQIKKSRHNDFRCRPTVKKHREFRYPR